jgi:mannose-1-phosphate guanylyltransferase
MNKSVLEHQIDFLKDHGITDIIIASDTQQDQLKQRFGDGRAYGIKIKYIVEDKPMGTAGAISLARDFIEGSFLMLNVDTLMNPNIHDITDFHRQHGKLATVLLTTTDDPSRFGVVKMKGNQVLKFTEKPKADSGTSRLINAGLCIFEKKVADIVPNRKIMIEELFKNLSKRNQLMGFLHGEPIFDVGTKEGYERAEKEWVNYKAN